jgi:glycosyltransferase involved in cell wall biosynthesis
MLRVVMRAARCVAVHNARVAAALREEFPDVPVEAIHLGTAPFESADNAAARARVRARFGVPENAVLFAAFGKMTAEKRIEVILRAFETMAGERGDVHLLLAGDTSECAAINAARFSAPLSARVHVAGYIPDQAIGEYLAASDACLCLRWPTALETSAAWVRCLAAGKPTVISDLAHLVDIPAIDPRGRRASPASAEPIAIAVDLLDEHDSLLLALRTLADDPRLRDALGRAGQAYWDVNHTIEVMVRDYGSSSDAPPRAPCRPLPICLRISQTITRRSRARSPGSLASASTTSSLLRRAADDKKKPLSALSTQRYFVLCDLGDLRGFFPIVCGQRDSHS